MDIKANAAKQSPAEYLGGIIARHESLAGVATELGVSRKTVENWLRRYAIKVVRA